MNRLLFLGSAFCIALVSLVGNIDPGNTVAWFATVSGTALATYTAAIGLLVYMAMKDHLVNPTVRRMFAMTGAVLVGFLLLDTFTPAVDFYFKPVDSLLIILFALSAMVFGLTLPSNEEVPYMLDRTFAQQARPTIFANLGLALRNAWTGYWSYLKHVSSTPHIAHHTKTTQLIR